MDKEDERGKNLSDCSLNRATGSMNPSLIERKPEVAHSKLSL